MAHIGGIPFIAGELTFDSAAAFLLSAPPDKAAVLQVNDAEIEVSPGVAYVVARFSGAGDATSAQELGLGIAQMGLDLASILGKGDFLTERVSEEYIVAWQGREGRTARIHSTTTFSFSVPSVSITARDAEGRDVTKPHPIPKHHPAFRYFRLSQASSDLHEAFRNMYLAFELLLSSKVPVGPGERERDWLQRGLAIADADLDLQKLIGRPDSDHIDELISEVYTAARLPLFHAKAGKDVIQPHGADGERERVLAALELLTRVVLEISKTWFGARRMGGGVFHGWVYEKLRHMYSTATILALPEADALDSGQKGLADGKYRTAVKMRTEVQDHPHVAGAPRLFGEVAVADLWKGDLERIEIVGPEHPILAHTLESPLSLSGLERIEYVDVPSIVNRNQPRTRFPK